MAGSIIPTTVYLSTGRRKIRRSPFLPAVLCAGMLCASAISTAQVPPEFKLKESVVSAKAPKRLRTYIPFWGTPLRTDGTKETCEILEDCVVCMDNPGSHADTSSNHGTSNNHGSHGSTFRWLCWNLDLASTSADRYKFQRFIKNAPAEKMLMQAIDECYRWAWRKPYGNTNLTMGPLYISQNGSISQNASISQSARTPQNSGISQNGSIPQDGSSSGQYAWFVAVCKQERTAGPAPLGFTSVAFVIPFKSSPGKNIYDCSRSVNGVEFLSGYNLFPKLPQSVQEQVEELTVYELFCPFQEIDEDLLLEMEPEFEGGEFSDPFDKE